MGQKKDLPVALLPLRSLDSDRCLELLKHWSPSNQPISTSLQAPGKLRCRAGAAKCCKGSKGRTEKLPIASSDGGTHTGRAEQDSCKPKETLALPGLRPPNKTKCLSNQPKFHFMNSRYIPMGTSSEGSKYRRFEHSSGFFNFSSTSETQKGHTPSPEKK